MKYLSVLLLVSILFSACDSVVTENTSRIYPCPTNKIDKIEINDNVITATIFVETPCPRWEHYKSETFQNELVYTSRIFGIHDDQPCKAVMSSFTTKETIRFYTKGEKTLRFWQNGSTYLDTTITLQ